jgi:hypothetical protein
VVVRPAAARSGAEPGLARPLKALRSARSSPKLGPTISTRPPWVRDIRRRLSRGNDAVSHGRGTDNLDRKSRAPFNPGGALAFLFTVENAQITRLRLFLTEPKPSKPPGCGSSQAFRAASGRRQGRVGEGADDGGSALLVAVIRLLPQYTGDEREARVIRLQGRSLPLLYELGPALRAQHSESVEVDLERQLRLLSPQRSRRSRVRPASAHRGISC